MASTNVHITMTAAQADVVRAWMDSGRSVDAYTKQLARVGMTGQQAGARVRRGVDSVIPGLTRAVTGFLGVGVAMNAIGNAASLIRREWEQLKDVQSKSKDASVSFAKELGRFRIGGLPVGSDITADEIAEKAMKLETSTTPAVRLQAAGSAITAIDDPSQTRRAAETGLRVAELLPGGQSGFFSDTEINEFAKAVSRIQFREPGKTTEETLGQLFSASISGPGGPEKMQQFIENAVPAIEQAMQRLNLTFEESAANLIAIANEAQDPTFESSRTTFVQFVGDLATKLRMAGKEGQEIIDSGQAFKALRERKSPVAKQIAREFLGAFDDQLAAESEETGVPLELLLEARKKRDLRGELRGRARTLFAGQQLIQAEESVDPADTAHPINRMKRIEEQFLKGEAALADLNARIAAGRASQFQQPAEVQQAIDTATDSLKVNPARAVRGQMADAIGELLPLLDGSSLETKLRSFAQRLGTTNDRPETVIAKFRDEIQGEMGELIREAAAAARIAASTESGGGLFGVPTEEARSQAANDAAQQLTQFDVISAMLRRLEALTGAEVDKSFQAREQEMQRARIGEVIRNAEIDIGAGRDTKVPAEVQAIRDPGSGILYELGQAASDLGKLISDIPFNKHDQTFQEQRAARPELEFRDPKRRLEAVEQFEQELRNNRQGGAASPASTDQSSNAASRPSIGLPATLAPATVNAIGDAVASAILANQGNQVQRVQIEPGGPPLLVQSPPQAVSPRDTAARGIIPDRESVRF